MSAFLICILVAAIAHKLDDYLVQTLEHICYRTVQWSQGLSQNALFNTQSIIDEDIEQLSDI